MLDSDFYKQERKHGISNKTKIAIYAYRLTDFAPMPFFSSQSLNSIKGIDQVVYI